MIAEPGKRPLELIDQHNWRQITDEKEIEAICRNVIASNPKPVAQFRAGKEKAFKALVSDVFKLSERKANMRLAVLKLKELLK